MGDKPKLTLVKPTEESTINAVLYGPPKSGKTVGAATAPGKLLYLNADTANATRFAHSRRDFDEAHVEDLSTLIAAIDAADDYDSVVLDPVADVYRVVLEGLSNRALSPQIQQYGDAGTHLERFCRALCEKPVNAVFVCHEIAVPNEETGGMEYLPFVSTKSGSPVFAGKLMAMVDVIGYTGVVPPEKEGDPVKYVAQLINARGRRGGDRFGALGTSREVDLAEWAKLASEAMRPKKDDRKEQAA
jgi:hypothetical protein